MNHFQPPTDDRQFILNEELHAPEQWQALPACLPACAEVDADLMRQAQEAAGKLMGDLLVKTQAPGASPERPCCLVDAFCVRWPCC